MIAVIPVSVLALAALVLGAHDVAYTCDPRPPTRETSLGPHDFSALPPTAQLWREGDAGQPLFLRLRVLDTCSQPIAGARVRLLHADQNGEHVPHRWRAELRTDDSGALRVQTVFPGYAGPLPRHMHFIIEHPAHRSLVTRLFFKNDPAADHGVEDLAMVLEEVPRGEDVGWIAGYEFVLAPR